MRTTWLSDAGEFLLRVVGKWRTSLTAVFFFVLSVPENIFGFPVRNYLPQWLFWVVAIAFILVSAFQVYREQKFLIPADNLPHITVKPTRCSIQGPNWTQNTLAGDFKIVVTLDIRNSGSIGLLSINATAINYNGQLFNPTPQKVMVKRPSLAPGTHFAQPVKIEKGDVWPDYSLEIILPSKQHSIQSFIRAVFTPGAKEFEIILDADVETLGGTRVPHDPVSVKGDISSLLENAVSRWQHMLQHGNLNDRERQELLTAVLGLVKDYYAHLHDSELRPEI